MPCLWSRYCYLEPVAQRILFVDDEAPIRELLSLFFRKKGFEVATANDTREGRRLLDEKSFDLAILDVNLAGENGLELLGLIKQKHPKVPVIIFSGMLDDDDLIQRALLGGANGFMRKTESLETLHQEVRKHLAAAL